MDDNEGIGCYIIGFVLDLIFMLLSSVTFVITVLSLRYWYFNRNYHIQQPSMSTGSLAKPGFALCIGATKGDITFTAT